MKPTLTAILLLLASMTSLAHGEELCVSDNPAIKAIQTRWSTPLLPDDQPVVAGFQAKQAKLLPLAVAEQRFGRLVIKSSKTMRFFNQYAWTVEADGDYWLVADSGAWLDVRDGGQALEPLTFNHGLRCAGIHKALQFHLHRGSYVLVVASDETDQVKIAAERAP